MLTLKSKEDFKNVFENGTKSVLRSIVIYKLPNSTNQLRVGAIASKRSLPRAVDRNYAKRRMKELIRAVGKPGNDYIIIAKHGVIKSDFQFLLQEISKVA